MIGQNGNIFNLTAIATHALQRAGMRDKVNEMEDAFRQFAELSERKPNLLRAILNYCYTLINKFFFRLGFMHGLLGLKLALNHAKYSFLKYR